MSPLPGIRCRRPRCRPGGDSHRLCISRSGFTVLELALVILVAGVLLVLGLGVTSRVRERGQSAKCVHHLRNISILLHLTLKEHRGYLPWYDRNFSAQNGLWWHRIYTTSRLGTGEFSSLFTCPADPTPRTIAIGSGRTLDITYRYNKRIGYFGPASGGGAMKWIYPNYPLAFHPAPARAPVLADSSRPASDNAPAFDEWEHVYSAHGGSRYGEGTYGNVLFLDGHVEQIAKPGPGGTVPDRYDLKFREY